MTDLIKLLFEAIRTIYPIYKDWKATKKEEADQSGNSDRMT